ncbi:hypothetical protein [Aquabacterium sp.]|uniref:hypothetical protein n=1 Tax=Aquabacterium sp. TaxID=1872578 RepID=UPI0025BA8B44|nr:hypothetical protein [Aquabacterium sp.]
MKHQPFEALVLGLDQPDTLIDVVPTKVDGSNETYMTLLGTNEAVYITKAQCMEFFGLVDSSKYVITRCHCDAQLER